MPYELTAADAAAINARVVQIVNGAWAANQIPGRGRLPARLNPRS
jgi:hypothetical protein